MTLFLTYELKVAVLIAVFYIFWRLLLANETWHRLNRIVLLSTAVASFVLPLCVITIHHTVELMPAADAATWPADGMPMPVPAETASTAATAGLERHYYWQLPLTIIYIIGVVVVLLRMLLSLWRLHRMTAESEIHPLSDGHLMAVSEKVDMPFSWWNTVFMNHNDYEEGTTALLTHELEHLRQHHSADVVLVELLTALQWFNPAMWMLRADLRTIHEYEADQQVLSHGFNDIQYLQLLIRKAAGRGGYSLANGISNSALKKRVTMIMKPQSTRNSMLKLLALVPIVGIGLALNANTVTDYVYDQPQKQQPVKKGKKAGTIKMNSQDIEVVVTESAPTEQADRKPLKVRGIVRDKEKGEPVVGAIIKVGNSKAGTVTDQNGEFSIDVKEGDVVVASYVGYSSDAIVIKDSRDNYAFVLEKDDSDVTEKTYDVVEQMPQFPGGPAALLEYLSKSVKYPEKAHKNGIQGRVIATFIVEKDGRISNAHVVRSVDPSLDAEALRVIDAMPNWVPGRQNGEPARVKYSIPVTFKLDSAAPAEKYVLEIDGKAAHDSDIANIPADEIVSIDVVPAKNGQPKKIAITTKKKK
ncbi:MAG: TonB family protein [Prevotella sp.]|nr:TonB family protein [Prevotella sp.]